MNGVELTVKETPEGDREFTLTVSKKALTHADLAAVERNVLYGSNDEEPSISYKLFELAHVVHHIETQATFTVLHEGIDDSTMTVNVFDEKNNIIPE